MGCGKIVCAQEGSGPCFFCGTLVCSKEETEVMVADLKSISLLLHFVTHSVFYFQQTPFIYSFLLEYLVAHQRRKNNFEARQSDEN
uniref:Zf-C2HC5 domain-containing protein n=1 Tax=Angiostrongylus cantonensis TaxID=6313 RepID=A0A0K0CW85_ANGCA